MERLRDKLNARQEKAVLRMLAEGPEGCAGGMSAGKYTAITGTSGATATRDLAELVEAGAMTRSGELRHTRYVLDMPVRRVRGVRIDEAGNVVER